MKRNVVVAACVLFSALPVAQAQWELQNSNSTADLRGIHSVGNGVAWASGTNGTVLRTEDGGYVWQSCSMPPGAEHLDFRGIQAFDADTAIVMSSGKGDLSRLYKTTDGCHSWKLVATNPDADGFWDAVKFEEKFGMVLGDPVDGKFEIWRSRDAGDSWIKEPAGTLIEGLMHQRPPSKNDGVFAASNSALFLDPDYTIFVTGGPSGSRLYVTQYLHLFHGGGQGGGTASLPLASSSESAGAFSIASCAWNCWVVVGGDYRKPDDASGTAAFSVSPGNRWHAAATPPHGYRSSVAYDAATETWITVGPNGTDISSDDGRNWRPLHPNPALHEAPDADRNWNALSLPFVVGPHGRIGKLNPKASAP
jgi:photosystem II stability/assembly factor-like uncharacterized protein